MVAFNPFLCLMLKRGIKVSIKHTFLNYLLDVILETTRKRRNRVMRQMDSSKEILSEEVDTHSCKQKRDPLFLFL